MSNSESYVLENSIDASIFDEMEDTSAIRTIIDFQLLNSKDGSSLSFNELGTNEGVTGTLFGRVVEPLPLEWRGKLLSLICTVPQKMGHDDAERNSQPEKKLKLSTNDEEKLQDDLPPNFDRSAIQIGDNLDGYCTKTFKWYESKIVAIKKNDYCNEDLLKIHFKGWGSKHDEWIERSSERLAPLGSSEYFAKEAAKRVSLMVPWFECEKLIDRASEALGPLPRRREIYTRIDNVEDWCIDYTYPNPCMWLIAGSGVWYRIAGPLTPGGIWGSPHKSYTEVFRPISEKFFCSAHVAMCLLDFLPENPKTSLATVIQEVSSRSKGQVDETSLLYFHSFLEDQLRSLSPLVEGSKKKIDMNKCVFIQQLIKQGQIFDSNGGIEARLTKIAKDSRRDSSGSGEVNSLLRHLHSSNKEESSESKDSNDNKENKESKVAVKLKYPIEDTELWKMELAKGVNPRSHPRPLHSVISPSSSDSSCDPLVHPNLQFRCPSDCFGLLLSTWTTLVNFRKVLSLPIVSLEFLDISLSDHSGIHPMLREIHVQILTALLVCRAHSAKLSASNTGKSKSCSVGNNTSSLPGYSVEVFEKSSLKLLVSRNRSDRSDGPTENFDGFTKELFSNKDGISDDAFSTHCFMGLDSLLCSSQGIDVKKLQEVLCSGDTWVEVLTIMIGEQLSIPVPDYFDSLAECSKIVEAVSRLPEAKPFRQPVNPVDDRVPDYWTVVRDPMDLETVLRRIKSGWYDLSDATLESDIKMEQEGIENSVSASIWFNIADLVDVYCPVNMRWFHGRVEKLEGSIVSIRYSIAWTTEEVFRVVDFELPSNSIAPYKSIVSRKSKRYLSPDQLLKMKYKKYEKAPPPISSSVSAFLALNQAVPLANTRTKGRGHQGVYEDIKKIRLNCETYYGSTHILSAAGKTLEDMFERLYHRRISSVLQSKGNNILPSSGSIRFSRNFDLSEVLTKMRNFDYENNSFAVKLCALQWLCDEVLCTTAVRDQLDDVSELRYTIFGNDGQRRTKKGRNSNGTSKRRKVTSGETDDDPGDDDPGDDEDEDADLEMKKAKAASKATEVNMAFSRLKELEAPRLRLMPLGSDRDHRTYWAVSIVLVAPEGEVGKLDEVTARSSLQCPSRIFCETQSMHTGTKNVLDIESYVNSGSSNMEWITYDTYEDVAELIDWLCEKGTRELKLKRELEIWLSENSNFMRYRNAPVPPEPASLILPLKRDRDVSDAMTSLNRESKTRINVLFPGNHREPFENFSSAWETRESKPVAFVVSVQLPSSGQIGLKVKMFQGSMVVMSFKFQNEDEQCRSAGKDAGIRIGDRIFATEGQLINAVTDLQGTNH